ncbi:MAG: hypothetical protein H6738_15045 [Alphaproteobacteria bacterium]|nr:hypothetical protein [Alphaproteobacteria bacterium]MCB9698094.1 hypothetical protein [Alphaproteobacteria bacterium]
MLVVELFLLRTGDDGLAKRLADAALRDPDALGAVIALVGEDDELGDDDGIEVLAAPTLVLEAGTEGSMHAGRKGTVGDGRSWEQVPVLELDLGVLSAERVAVSLELVDTPITEDHRLGDPRTTTFLATMDPDGSVRVFRPAEDLVLVASVTPIDEEVVRAWLIDRDTRRMGLLADQGKRGSTSRRLRIERRLLDGA